MQATKYRAQILLEPEQHAALAEIAQNENRSISDLVREIVRQWLDEQDRNAQIVRELQALDELTQMRLAIQEQHGVYRATCSKRHALSETKIWIGCGEVKRDRYRRGLELDRSGCHPAALFGCSPEGHC